MCYSFQGLFFLCTCCVNIYKPLSMDYTYFGTSWVTSYETGEGVVSEIKDKYSVGEAARLSNVSTKTLRITMKFSLSYLILMRTIITVIIQKTRFRILSPQKN